MILILMPTNTLRKVYNFQLLSFVADYLCCTCSSENFLKLISPADLLYDFI